MARLAVALGAALVALTVCAGGAAAEPTVDLTGTWHMLIYYRDDTAHDPRQMRWDDRLWSFQRDAKGLEWTEYPIVVFQDETGRFEKSATGLHRVVGAWAPNPAQLAEIQGGLEYNTRGTKSKTLHGSDTAGWSSGTRSTPAAANVITYSENWSIGGLPTKPVFTRDDILGSANAEHMEGRTQYVTQSIEEGGNLLRGTFERDGTRHGTFLMRRSGTAKVTEGSGKSQSQRETEAFFRNYGGADFFSLAELQALKDGLAAGGAPKDGDKALRDKVRAEIERKSREQGVEPSLVEPQIDRLTETISSMLLEGKSPEEIQRALGTSSPRP